MMRTLIRKELRQLIPLAVLIFVLMALNLIYIPLSKRPDESTWVDATGYLMPDGGIVSAVMFLILGLMTAFSLFPREFDEKTIEFLHSLPVSRHSIFAAKTIAACIILWGGILVAFVVDWVVQVPNNQTFTGDQFSIDTAATAGFLLSVYSFIVLSHGIFLSFFRRFGLIIYGIMWWIVWTLEKISPSFGYLDCMKLVILKFHGQTLLVPWQLLFFHLGIAGIILFLSALMWMTPAERFSHWYQNLFQQRKGRILLFLGVFLIVVLVISLFLRISLDQEAPRLSDEYYEPFETARFSTKYYRFTYPVNMRTTALPLIHNADAVYSAVRDVLSAKITDPVVVDLTEVSSEHAGIAGWKKIRMDIRGDKKPQDHLHVLYHETVHVFAASESNKKIINHHNSTTFFNEGLAEYLAFQAYPNENKLTNMELLAAISWKRHDIHFQELTNTYSFKADHYEYLYYPLGETWVKVLADTCGTQALGNLLRAIGRKDAPKDLDGVFFWQDALREIGCDLERVNGLWIQYLSDFLDAHKDKAEQIPRLSGGVSGIKEDNLIIKAYLDRPVMDKTARFIIRVRDNAADNENRIQSYYATDPIDPLNSESGEIVFNVPSSQLIGPRFDYQFGYIFQKKALPYFESWQSGDIPE